MAVGPRGSCCRRGLVSTTQHTRRRRGEDVPVTDSSVGTSDTRSLPTSMYSARRTRPRCRNLPVTHQKTTEGRQRQTSVRTSADKPSHPSTPESPTLHSTPGRRFAVMDHLHNMRHMVIVMSMDWRGGIGNAGLTALVNFPTTRQPNVTRIKLVGLR